MIRYFAYGSDLHRDSIADWCRHADRPLPRRDNLRPAVLSHHRICFPTHDQFFGGGVADVVRAPGKSVCGALMDLSVHGLETLERFDGRSRSQREIVRVTPYTGGPPVDAITFRIGQPDLVHIPPSAVYLDRLTETAAEIGISMMWVMHLKSFPAKAALPRDVKTDSQTTGCPLIFDVALPERPLFGASRRARPSPRRNSALIST